MSSPTKNVKTKSPQKEVTVTAEHAVYELKISLQKPSINIDLVQEFIVSLLSLVLIENTDRHTHIMLIGSIKAMLV